MGVHAGRITRMVFMWPALVCSQGGFFKAIAMKIPIELNVTDKGTFLNFWDAINGNDVICEVVDGALFRVKGKRQVEIPLDVFVDAVKKAAKQQE